MSYRQFQFRSYGFDVTTKTLTLEYGYDQAKSLRERFRFDFDFVDYDKSILDRALQHLFFMAGISYYKAFLAPEITIQAGDIDETLRGFLAETYQKGLGEFWYVNKLDPRTTITFPVTGDSVEPMLAAAPQGMLVGIGGGKDSLVSVEALKESGQDVATWSLGHRKQLTPLVTRIALPHYWVDREWDRQLLELNNQGAYNGHVPISAIIACVGTVVSVLSGRRDHVVSNEQSANEPTLVYEGIPINHQYSKSQEFERNYQRLLRNQFGDSLRYYSLLRPLSELRISELFAKEGFDTYRDVFSSCNRAFRHDSPGLFWDGTCPKCAFVNLMLAPFVPSTDLERLFDGSMPLQNPALDATYRQLLGIEGDKPLECVGEVRESRQAMRVAQDMYAGLEKFQFELAEDYDFRKQLSHEIPGDIWQVVQANL